MLSIVTGLVTFVALVLGAALPQWHTQRGFLPAFRISQAILEPVGAPFFFPSPRL